MVLGLASEPGVKKPAAGVSGPQVQPSVSGTWSNPGAGRVSKWACPWRGVAGGGAWLALDFFAAVNVTVNSSFQSCPVSRLLRQLCRGCPYRGLSISGVEIPSPLVSNQFHPTHPGSCAQGPQPNHHQTQETLRTPHRGGLTYSQDAARSAGHWGTAKGPVQKDVCGLIPRSRKQAEPAAPGRGGTRWTGRGQAQGRGSGVRERGLETLLGLPEKEWVTIR